MRADEVKRLEAAVRTANPVPYLVDLAESVEAAAVTHLVEHHRRTETDPATRRVSETTGRPPSRRWRSAGAFAAGVGVTLLLGGAVLLFTRADDTPVAGQPTTVGTPGDVAPPPAVAVAPLLTISGHPEGVSAVAWSPDGTRLATASRAIEGGNGVAKVWDAATGVELLSFPLGTFETVRVDLAYSPDGSRLAVGGPVDAVFDAATGDELLGGLGDRALAYSPDGTRIALGGAWGWAAVIDAGTGAEQLTLPWCPGPRSWVWAAAWSPDGTRLATTCWKSIEIWDATTGDGLLSVTSPFGVTDVAWSPDGTRVAAAGGDPASIAEVWDTATGDSLVTITGHTGEVSAVAWSPDGAWLVTASEDWTAKVWDADSGDELTTLTGHTAQVTDVAWSLDGTRIATASEDGTATIWSVRSEIPGSTAEPTTPAVGEADTTLAPVGTGAAPTGPTTVFSWAYPLSDWVTEAEMTATLQDLSTRYYTGTDLGGEAVLARPGGDFVWAVGHWSVGVHPGHGSSLTGTDPRLPQGVTYLGASQSYVFSGPNSHQQICITLTTPGTTASVDEEPNYEDMFFEIATFLLHEMGWAD